MSSTHRQKHQIGLDQYHTPAWATRAILMAVPDIVKNTRSVFDPCLGKGQVISATADFIAEKTDTKVTCSGIEIDPTLASGCPPNIRVQVGDSLPMDWGKHDLIITNPPFSLAQEFAVKVNQMVRKYDSIGIMLLRLSFLEGKKRVGFHESYPADVYVLSKRPSFTGKKTDSCAYAWFVWGKNRGNRWYLLPVGSDLSHRQMPLPQIDKAMV